MSNKKKIYRRLGRRCPECGGELDIVAIDTFVDGVKYSEKEVQCSSCDYYEDYRTSYNKNKDKHMPKW